MSYLKNSLTTNEEIKMIVNYHWFVWINPIFVFIGSFIFIFIGLFISTIHEPIISSKSFYFLGLILIMNYLIQVLNIYFTEQGITTKKSIKKTGIISVKTEELFISKTETVEINQSFWGRIFGFGNIKLTGTGNSYLIFGIVSNPLDVKKTIEELVDSV